MGLFKNCVFLWIEKLLSLFTDKIICISEAERISALNSDIASEKLSIILNGIDIQAVEQAIPFSKEEFGIPSDAYLVGMVGRITLQKAPDTFIKAARLIKERIPEAWFMIVGDGELRKDIEDFAKCNNIELYITGWTDVPYKYVKMFDLAMLLSRWEGFGLVLVEYMAANINYIATKVDAIPTIVDDNIDGVLIDVDSPLQVVDAVWKLYCNKEYAASLRYNALKTVRNKYDICRVAEQHVEMFKELMQK